MEKVKFSIIYNSRERPNLLKEALSAVQNTAYNLDTVEVLVNFDTDDDLSRSVVKELKNRFSFFKPFFTKHDDNLHNKINWLANQTTGDFIWPMGDDCHIITNHWDKIAQDLFQKTLKDDKSRIAIGAVESTSVDKEIHKIGWYCDAPIFTRECLNLGYLIPTHYISLGADVHVWRIYKECSRIIDMTEILFDHTTHNTISKVVNPDKTAYEYRLRQSKFQQLDPFTIDISDDVKKLQELINE